MNIAVNTRLLLTDKLEGIGNFTFHTLKRLVKNHPEHSFFYLFDRAYDKRFITSGNIIPIVISPPTRHPLLWYFWLEYRLPAVFRKYKIDLFVSPDGFLSLHSDVKSLAVIHDLNFVSNPDHIPLITRHYYLYFFKKYAAHAHRIATVSEYSKKDIAEKYAVQPSSIDVVYNGSDDIFSPVSLDVKTEIYNEYTNGDPYFIYVGSLHPRKNISNLLKSFDVFKQRVNTKIKLVLVGERMFLTKDISNTLQSIKNRVDIIFTGRVTTHMLHKLIGSAYAMTFVPFFEGFGIPVLEAMQCDIPVLTSNVTSLPEVGGNAVLYCNPHSVESIAQGMMKLYSDNQLYTSLIHNGQAQRLKFSWDRTADLLWESIEKCF